MSHNENVQDWGAAAAGIEQMLHASRTLHAFLIRRHGLYTWGGDLAEATRHLEVRSSCGGGGAGTDLESEARVSHGR